MHFPNRYFWQCLGQRGCCAACWILPFHCPLRYTVALCIGNVATTFESCYFKSFLYVNCVTKNVSILQKQYKNNHWDPRKHIKTVAFVLFEINSGPIHCTTTKTRTREEWLEVQQHSQRGQQTDEQIRKALNAPFNGTASSGTFWGEFPKRVQGFKVFGSDDQLF